MNSFQRTIAMFVSMLCDLKKVQSDTEHTRLSAMNAIMLEAKRLRDIEIEEATYWAEKKYNDRREAACLAMDNPEIFMDSIGRMTFDETLNRISGISQL